MAKLRSPILWILILAASLRFVQIDSPPLGRHAWRQSDTAGVARNYHRFDHGFLYPQVDWEQPGFVEMELPVYPWTTSLLYRVTGESEAAARLLSILASLLTIGFLYLIVARILGRRSAAWAAFLCAILPLSLFFGRAIMPESWMLAATTASLYAFLRWTEEGSWPFYVAAAMATALACLLKLTSLYLGLPLLYLAWQRWGRRTLVQWQFWLFGTLVAGSIIAWYGHAYQLGQEYGASFHILTAAGTDKWGNWQLLLEPDFYHQVFLGTFGGRMLTWAGLPVFLVGLLLPRRRPLERLFDVWLLAVVIVILLASGGSYQHDYYSLPILLPAVVFMAKVFDRGWERRKALLLMLASLIVILSGYRHLGTLDDERLDSLDATVAQTLSARTSSGDLVISCNAADPTWLYLADRRGWGRDCSTLDKAGLEALIAKGAQVLVSQPAASDLSPSPTLLAYLRTFHQVQTDDATTLLVGLSNPLELGELPWKSRFEESFSDRPPAGLWQLADKTWTIQESALLGMANSNEATRATLIEPAIDCQLCRLSLDLTMLSAAEPEQTSRRKPRKRNAKRPLPVTSIRVLSRDTRSGIVLTLDTRSSTVRFQQVENGNSLSSRRTDFALQTDRDQVLEVVFDLFDFRVLIDGETVVVADNRLRGHLEGNLRLQVRSGGLAVRSVSWQTLSLSDSPKD